MSSRDAKDTKNNNNDIIAYGTGCAQSTNTQMKPLCINRLYNFNALCTLLKSHNEISLIFPFFFLLVNNFQDECVACKNKTRS